MQVGNLRDGNLWSTHETPWETAFVICQVQRAGNSAVMEELLGISWWFSGEATTCHCRRHRFDPWSARTLHAAEQLSHAPQLLMPASSEPVLCKERRPSTIEK